MTTEKATARLSTTRLLLGVAVPASAIASGFVPYLLLRNDLPDRVATHFDLSGTPDDSMTHGVLAVFTGSFIAAGCAVLVGLAFRRKPLPAAVGPIAGFLGAFFAGLFAAVLAGTAITQRDIEDWTEAGSAGWVILGAIALAASLGTIAARLATVLPITEPDDAGDNRPVMELAPGERAVWAKPMHSRLLSGIGVAVIALGVIVAIGTVWWIALPSVIGGAAALALATLSVRADGTGLHVKYGWLPWPKTHVAIEDIESASVIDIRPSEWGGWGYRGSLKLMNRAAVVHRAGPGIRLDLRNGKAFAVTVDEPEIAVSLLNAEIARLRTPA